jgi:uncharacterized membrane protein YhaH (DUF805 family)
MIIKTIAILALVGALADNPYSYYQLLRWFICGLSIYLAYSYYQEQKDGWMWVFGIMAVIFNPIQPIHFDKEVWSILNIITAGIILISTFKKKKRLSYYLDVLDNKYATFSGRASRSEFWYFILVDLIISLILIVIDIYIGTYYKSIEWGLLSGIYSLAVLSPRIAVQVRRLHDTTRSGFWILLSLIPFVGIIVLLLVYAEDSYPGENKYGRDPKEKTMDKKKNEKNKNHR